MVSVQTDAINVHTSNLEALERIAQHSPEIASKLIDATNHTVKHDSRKYIAGAICAASVCCIMLLCVAYIIVYQGFWSGLIFFLVCAAVAAVFSAVFTGKSESLSWTIGFFRGQKDSKPD